MQTVLQEPLADDALLKTYRGGDHPGRWGHYGDCFSLRIDKPVSLSEFVTAFYTTPLFRTERVILRLLAALPSTDDDVQQLLAGTRETFAAWKLEARTDTQLLMGDRYGKTRSWFRVTPQESGGTLLQFGSAVASMRAADGSMKMSTGFHVLLGLHRLYSRMLLRAASARILPRPDQRRPPGRPPLTGRGRKPIE
ncbi:MAG TPA: hypothetical protein VE046_10715 [Steroidobacteraceae bacterium]|nr:hypothetical protein [Steroidobacteraceae bacterium]